MLFCDGCRCELRGYDGGGRKAGLLVRQSVCPGSTADSVIKNANIGIGTVQPNSACDVSFDLLAPVVNTGGVVFVEFFSQPTRRVARPSAVILLGPVNGAD